MFGGKDGKGSAAVEIDADGDYETVSEVVAPNSMPTFATAQEAHNWALEKAIDKQLSVALPAFEQSVQMSPSNVHYLNDLGVTYMRLGMLDNAKNTFVQAQEKDPIFPEIVANLKALQEHLDFRDEQLREKANKDDEFNEYGDVDEEEEAKEQQKQQQKRDKRAYKPGMYEDPSAPAPVKSAPKPKTKSSSTTAAAAASSTRNKAGNNLANAEARAAHNEAIRIATDESIVDQIARLNEALPLFQLAVEKDPTSVTFLNDLGVTLLRVGKLDECKEVLERAQAMDPTNKEVVSNFEALGQHMRHREEQVKKMQEEQAAINVNKEALGGAGSYDDDDELAEAEDEEAPGEYDNYDDVVDDPVPEDVAGWFGNWFSDEALWKVMGQSIKDGKPIVIKNALSEKMAEKLHKELYTTPGYQQRQGFDRGFQFSYNLIEDSDDVWRRMHVTNDVVNFLNSEAVKKWAAEIAGGYEIDEPVKATAMWFKARDYSIPQADYGLRPSVGRMVFGFELHLAKNWDEAMGGDLVFLQHATALKPSFNTMTIVPPNVSNYLVSPIAATCPNGMRRLSLVGQFISSKRPREKRAPREPEFVLEVDGANGAVAK